MNEIMLQDKPYEYYDHIKNKNMKIGTQVHNEIAKWLVETEFIKPIGDDFDIENNYLESIYNNMVVRQNGILLKNDSIDIINSKGETFNPDTGEWELKPKYIWI